MRHLLLRLRPLVTARRLRIPDGLRREFILWRWKRASDRWGRSKPSTPWQREHW